MADRLNNLQSYASYRRLCVSIQVHNLVPHVGDQVAEKMFRPKAEEVTRSGETMPYEASGLVGLRNKKLKKLCLTKPHDL
jgi:hypothetical protein